MIPSLSLANPQSLRESLAQGANVNETRTDGNNALFHTNDVEIIRILIAAGTASGVNKLAPGRLNALFIHLDNPEIVKLLLDAGIGADIAEGQEGKTCLFLTTNVQVMQYLLDYFFAIGRTDVINRRDYEGRNALFGVNDIDIAALLIKAGIEINIVAYDGSNIFFDWGSQMNTCLCDSEIICLLVNAGANVNFTNSRGDNLLFGKHGNDSELVKLFLQKGINFNHLNRLGQNALFHISNPECVKLLLSAGFTGINQICVSNSTPLIVAANEEIVRILLENGATLTVNQIDHTNYNALFDKNLAVTKLLIEHIDLNAVNSDGENILFSFNIDRDETLQLLLEAGVNCRQINNYGESVLFRMSDDTTMELFLKYGADEIIDVKDLEGKTALSAAQNFSVAYALVKAGADLTDYQIPIDKRIAFDELHRNYFIFLLDNGWNIENFRQREEIDLVPLLFRHYGQMYGSDRYSFWKFLANEGYPVEISVEMPVECPSFEELRTSLVNRSSGRFRELSKVLRYNQAIVENVLDLIYDEGSIRLNSLLFHQKVYPEITVLVRDFLQEGGVEHQIGSFRVDTLEKAKLLAILKSTEPSAFTYPYLYLDEYQNLDSKNYTVLNKIIAPLLLEALYLHPVSQQNLSMKRREQNTPLVADDYSIFLTRNLRELFFTYFTVNSILEILKIDYPTLYCLRLRTDYLDNRSLQEILRDNEKSLIEMLTEKYGPLYDENSLEFLWMLLFEQ